MDQETIITQRVKLLKKKKRCFQANLQSKMFADLFHWLLFTLVRLYSFNLHTNDRHRAVDILMCCTQNPQRGETFSKAIEVVVIFFVIGSLDFLRKLELSDKNIHIVTKDPDNVIIHWFMDWQTNWLIDWKIDWQIDWLIDWLTHWQIEWLIHWLIDSLTDSLNDCLIDFICWFKTAFSSTVSSYWLHTAYSGWCSIFAEQQQVLSKQVLSFFSPF